MVIKRRPGITASHGIRNALGRRRSTFVTQTPGTTNASGDICHGRSGGLRPLLKGGDSTAARAQVQVDDPEKGLRADAVMENVVDVHPMHRAVVRSYTSIYPVGMGCGEQKRRERKEPSGQKRGWTVMMQRDE